MAGEAPGGGAVQAGGGEGVKAQLRSAGVDILGNSLQAGEILDFLQLVAGLFQQRLVDDDAESLVAVTSGQQLAVFAVEVEVGGGHFVGEISAAQIQHIIAPGLETFQVAALEQGGGSAALVHFSGQGLGVGAGGGGHDGHLHAGLFGIGLGLLLPGGVGFMLEVEVVHLAALGGGNGGDHRHCQAQSQKQREELFHEGIAPFCGYTANLRGGKGFSIFDYCFLSRATVSYTILCYLSIFFIEKLECCKMTTVCMVQKCTNAAIRRRWRAIAEIRAWGG